MGSCTEGFLEDVRDGERIIYKVTDTGSGTTYNASVRMRKDGWAVEEGNDRFETEGGRDGSELDPEIRRRVFDLLSPIAKDERPWLAPEAAHDPGDAPG